MRKLFVFCFLVKEIKEERRGEDTGGRTIKMGVRKKEREGERGINRQEWNGEDIIVKT